MQLMNKFYYAAVWEQDWTVLCDCFCYCYYPLVQIVEENFQDAVQVVEENFDTWHVKMQIHLIEKGLWSIV